MPETPFEDTRPGDPPGNPSGNPPANWLDDRVEAFVDGTLPADELRRFESALTAEPALRDEIDLARMIGRELPNLGSARCPDHVVSGIMRDVRRDIRQSFTTRLVSALKEGIQPRLRPVLAMVLLVAVVVSSSLVRRAPETPPVASAEVTQALDEVKWTLAVLSDVGRQTGRSMRSDVLEPHVVQPIERSLNEVIQ